MKKFLRFLLLGMLVCTSFTPLSDKPNTMGDVYILTSQYDNTVITHFTHALFRLPSDCFINEVECSIPESISAFPKDFAPFTRADMHWSPNGKYMLFVDHRINESETQYLDELMLYNPQNGELEKLISGYKYISGITWNPSSEWAAMAIKKPDDKEMQIVLVSPDGALHFLPIKPALEAGYSPHIFNGQVFDDNQRPIQWLNENEMIFSRTRGETTTSPNDLPVISVTHFFKFDIQNNEEIEIDLPTRAYYHFSPNGSLAYFKEDEVGKIYDFESGKIQELKDFGSGTLLTNWSPDGNWLVVCGKDSSTYAITPDLKKKQKLIEGCPIFSTWMPDSDHIILFFMSLSTDGLHIDKSHWYVASISKKTTREIVIPGLGLDRIDSLNGIYVQPIKP